MPGTSSMPTWVRRGPDSTPRYPNALFFLERLTDAKFRRELQSQDFVTFVHKQQYYGWEQRL